MDIGKDEIMRYPDLYTKVILTIIATFLTWNTLHRFSLPSVQAQAVSSQYAVAQFTLDSMSKQYETDLATAINNATKGRELVSVIPFDERGKYLVVYK
jgi:hypothetical protein